MKKPFLYLAIFFFLLFYCRGRKNDGLHITKTAAGSNGMVVSAYPLASEAGIRILKNGGNAVDAAIAVQFALAVVYPAAGNIGGGGFMVIRLGNGKAYTLDFRETAPGKAYEKMYQNPDGTIIRNASITGHMASGVPGTVDGMIAAHEKFGELPWKDLIQPAIDLANNGFPLTKAEAESLNKNRDAFIDANTIPPDFLIKNHWSAGEILVQKDLARTLSLIRDFKRDGFYKGITAENIVNEMRRGKGDITKEDLLNYHSIWRKPITGEYKGYRFITMGPPSSGGLVLSQLLKMIEPFDPDTIGWNDPRYIHLICEAEKRAFADRAEYMGDEDFYPVPVKELTDSIYLQKRMKNFTFGEMTGKTSAGAIQSIKESDETTHFSIVDKEQNAVAVTTTLNNLFGSKVVVAGSGFFLNDEMDDFSIKPGHPNMFGLTGGEANSIQPHKRMLSSMTPTIIEKDGGLYCVLGSPGGSKIITTVFQVILNLIDFKMNPEQAVHAGRFHHQGVPDTLYYEATRLNRAAIRELEKIGYHPEKVSSIGRVDAVILQENQMTGVADVRGDDSASGY